MSEQKERSWGGARPGAGRRRVTLSELVLERRFSAVNHRHRRALFEGELPPVEDAGRLQELRVLQDRFRVTYRRSSDAAWVVRRFETLANEW